MNENKIGSIKGFTIIEALVAITILLLGVLGPLSTATRGITDGLIAKNQVIALGLAQEGIELVRAKVSSNPKGSLWLSGLDSCLPTGTCLVLQSSNTYQACEVSPSQTCDLRSDINGVYVSSGGTGQVFTRTIQVLPSGASSPLVADIEAKVIVDVGWYDKNQYRNVTLNTYVYNY